MPSQLPGIEPMPTPASPEQGRTGGAGPMIGDDDPLIGKMVADRYEVQARIGEGGMGVVYKARQVPVDRPIALKILAGELSTDEETVQRFLNEARIISSLRHPNTVTLYDFGKAKDGRLYIAMEYLSGGLLRDVLDRGRVGVLPAMRIVHEVCLSLAEAHAAGVTHRDLKPENIMFDDVFGEEFSLRVVDFGIAKLHNAAVALTAPGTRLGTPEYMAPEQAWGKEIDHRSDIYALGIILYELLTGQPPFESESSIEIYIRQRDNAPRPFSAFTPPLKIDRTLERLVLRMLAKAKEDRPQTVTEVARTLRRLIEKASPDDSADQAIEEQASDPPVRTATARFESAPALQAADGDERDEDEAVMRGARRTRTIILAALAALSAAGLGAILWF